MVAIEFCLVLCHNINSYVATWFSGFKRQIWVTTRVFFIAIEPPSYMSRHRSPCVTTYQDRLLLVFGVAIGVFYVVTREKGDAIGFGHGGRIGIATGFFSSQQRLAKEGHSLLRQDIHCRDRESC